MAGKAKKIITGLIVLVAVGAITGYFFWNKPHQDVLGASGVKVEAAALYQSFTSDSATAKQLYGEKVVEVSGQVSGIQNNQQQQRIALLKTASDGAYINCTLEDSTGAIKEGAAVTIKGICNGIGQGDADLGIMGDVYLVRCYLVK